MDTIPEQVINRLLEDTEYTPTDAAIKILGSPDTWETLISMNLPSVTKPTRYPIYSKDKPDLVIGFILSTHMSENVVYMWHPDGFYLVYDPYSYRVAAGLDIPRVIYDTDEFLQCVVLTHTRP